MIHMVLSLLHIPCIYRFGQNHIYTVYIRYIWQGNHQIYGHIRCIYTVLANPMYVPYLCMAMADLSHDTTSCATFYHWAQSLIYVHILTRTRGCIFRYCLRVQQLQAQAHQDAARIKQLVQELQAHSAAIKHFQMRELQREVRE